MKSGDLHPQSIPCSNFHHSIVLPPTITDLKDAENVRLYPAL